MGSGRGGFGGGVQGGREPKIEVIVKIPKRSGGGGGGGGGAGSGWGRGCVGRRGRGCVRESVIVKMQNAKMGGGGGPVGVQD